MVYCQLNYNKKKSYFDQSPRPAPVRIFLATEDISILGPTTYCLCVRIPRRHIGGAMA
jgi:hypothetical protein